jgi:hypothetical protein
MKKIYKRKIRDYLFHINRETFEKRFQIYYEQEFIKITSHFFDSFQIEKEIEVFENECSRKILELSSISRHRIEWDCPEISKCERIKLLKIEKDLKRIARNIYNENSFFDKLLPKVHSLITYSEIDLEALYKKRIQYFISKKLKKKFNSIEQVGLDIPPFFPEKLDELIDDFTSKVEIPNTFRSFDDEFYTSQLIDDIFFLSSLETLYSTREKDEFYEEERHLEDLYDYNLRELWKISRERAENIYSFDKSLREIANEICKKNSFFQELFDIALPLIRQKIFDEEKSLLKRIETFLKVEDNLEKVMKLAKSDKLGKAKDIKTEFGFKDFFIFTTEDSDYFDKVAVTDDTEFIQSIAWLFRRLDFIFGVVGFQSKFEFFGRLGAVAVDSFNKGYSKNIVYIDVILEAKKMREDWEKDVFENFSKHLKIHQKAHKWLEEQI